VYLPEVGELEALEEMVQDLDLLLVGPEVLEKPILSQDLL
jgi:hypothetical protein